MDSKLARQFLLSKGPFQKVPHKIVDHSLHLLTPAEWMILTVLRRFRDYRTGKSTPTIEQIQERTNISPNTIRRALRHMETRRFITIEPSPRFDCKGKPLPGHRNIYTINLDDFIENESKLCE